MMLGSKGQKAVHEQVAKRIANVRFTLESVKYEKLYYVSHAIYGQSVKNSILRRR